MAAVNNELSAKVLSSPGFMAGVCVIVAYQPKPGKEAELLSLVRARMPTLRQERLVTQRVPVVMRAKTARSSKSRSGESLEAIDAARRNPNALAM